MSSPFTTPANATWQTLLTELTLAYSERRQAVSQSVYTPAADKDVQAAAYWTTLQAWLEATCPSYINHVSGPLDPAGTAFLYFTLATWRTAAGLHASGFRRATEWEGITAPAWSYGQMQPNDIIGPWIFQDLQKGFGALRWTANTLSLGGISVGDSIYNCTPTYPLAPVVYTAPLDQEISLWGGLVDDDFLIDGIDVFAGQYLSSPPYDGLCNASHSIAQRDYFLKNAVKNSTITFLMKDNYRGYCGGGIMLLFRNPFTNA